MVGSSLPNIVLDVLNNERDLNCVNEIDIVLVLKKKKPSTPVDFRPISLCIVVYKLISKVVGNRLKG